MFEFFNNLSEVINAASTHRIWLWALTAIIVILTYFDLRTAKKIDELKKEIEELKNQFRR